MGSLNNDQVMCDESTVAHLYELSDGRGGKELSDGRGGKEVSDGMGGKESTICTKIQCN